MNKTPFDMTSSATTTSISSFRFHPCRCALRFRSFKQRRTSALSHRSRSTREPSAALLDTRERERWGGESDARHKSSATRPIRTSSSPSITAQVLERSLAITTGIAELDAGALVSLFARELAQSPPSKLTLTCRLYTHDVTVSGVCE